jgi:outer membrane murein-binding lipoprotein Lpp
MSTVAELQEKYDEISAVRQAAKSDFSISNARKQEIAEQYGAAGNALRSASKAAMAPGAQAPTTTQGADKSDRKPWQE